MTAQVSEPGRTHTGASLVGVAAALIVAVLVLAVGIAVLNHMRAPPPAQLANPLAPPDRSSPQATLSCVVDETTTASSIIRAAFARHVHSPGLFPSPEAHQAAANARAHLNLALSCLDLSAIAPASRLKVGTERVLMLTEVLERLPPPKAPAEAPLPERWTVPQSEITIAKVANGPRAGQYLFTADTVEAVPASYAAVKDLPSDAFDFYEFYSMSPGDLLPPKWYALIRELPDWALQEYADQAVWQWIGYALVLLLFAGFSVGLIVATRGRSIRKLLRPSYRRLIAPLGILIGSWAASEALQELNVTGNLFSYSRTGLLAVLYATTAWLVAAVMLSLADWVASASGLRPRSIDAGMMRLALRLVGVAGACGILAYGASELGVPLVGVVAGLGVGGLAIALAAQPTIENLIAGLMLYADRPVRVGDECKFGEYTGTVEEIGIRSTRIRGKDRSLTTIPNADFAKQRLTNTDRRDRLVVYGIVGLRYGTTQAQLQQVLEETGRLFERHPMIEDNASFLRLIEFGVNSLDLELNAQVVTRDRKELALLRQEILLAIAGIVEKAGTNLVQRRGDRLV